MRPFGTKHHRFARLCSAAIVIAGCALPAAAQQRSQIARPGPIPGDLTPRVQLFQCGDFQGHFGPLDYRKAHKDDRRLVESWHFDAELSMFLRGQLRGRTKAGTTNATSGFQYTLKALPNHPVALKVMEEAARKMGSEQPSSDYPMECWYLRAFMIAPDDPVVRAMYGVYLAHRDRPQEARHNLDLADRDLRQSRTMQFIIAEARLALRDYEGAQINGMRSARLGFKTDALEKELRAAGKWNEALTLPPDDAVVQSPAPASATSPASAASN